MEAFWQDLRFGLRLLVRTPGFTGIAVLTLALGIGANTAIFGMLDRVLLRPLPVPEPGRLAAIVPRYNVVSYPVYRDFRTQNTLCAGIAAYGMREMNLSRSDGMPVYVSGVVASDNYFEVLGVRPLLGRPFSAAEEGASGNPPVAILSHRLWRQHFGADPQIIGRTVRLNSREVAVVGVMPPAFRGTDLSSVPDIWIPIAAWPGVATGSWAGMDLQALTSRNRDWLLLIGRVKPDVSFEQAQAHLNAIAAGIEAAYPRQTPSGFSVTLHPLAAAMAGLGSRDEVARFVWLLMAMAASALLIAVANVANLLLVRAAGRQKEMAMRLALGANRGRVIRQMLTESLLLSLAGGTLGLLCSVWMAEALRAYALPGGIPVGALDLGLDLPLLGFAFLVSLLAGLLFGLWPALQTSGEDLIVRLKDRIASLSAPSARIRPVLITVQVALCLLLLIGAGLFVRSLKNALAIDLGFQPARVAVASLNLGLQRYTGEQAEAFYGQAAARIRSLPGVQSTSWTTAVPLSPSVWRESFAVAGYTPGEDEKMVTNANIIGTAYFRTMGIPLTRGRDFTDQDRAGRPGAVIVNEAMARRYWPGIDPVGRTMRILNTEVAVVGVARDAKYLSLRESPEPLVYLPLAQHIASAGLSTVTLLVRAEGEPDGIPASVRREIGRLDERLPLFDVKTFQDCLNEVLMTQRFGLTLLGLFSGLALVLAVVGIYGVVAYTVNQRVREIGIRLALGAQPRDILKLLIGRSSLSIGLGILAGLGAALGLTRLMDTFLYGLSPADPATFFLAALLLAGAAFLACYIPARRAMRVDPVVALRYE